MGDIEHVVWLSDSMEILTLKHALGNCSLGAALVVCFADDDLHADRESPQQLQ